MFQPCPATWSTPFLPCVQVSFGSNSEVRARNWTVRFTLKNRRRQPGLSGPKSATNGLMHRNKFEEIHWRKSDLQCDRTSVV